MRDEWVPVSASSLVVGVMSLVFGSLLNPADTGASAADMVRVVNEEGSRWLAMAVMYVFASLALTLGLPSVLLLFRTRAQRLGLTAVVVFAAGAVGTCGYALLMVFFRALVVADAVKPDGLARVTHDPGLTIFLRAWVGCFYLGVLLLAIALLVARSTPAWVPVLLALFVVLLPVASHLGRVGGAVQIMLLAIAFTGMAMTTVTAVHQATLARRPAF